MRTRNTKLAAIPPGAARTVKCVMQISILGMAKNSPHSALSLTGKSGELVCRNEESAFFVGHSLPYSSRTNLFACTVEHINSVWCSLLKCYERTACKKVFVFFTLTCVCVLVMSAFEKRYSPNSAFTLIDRSDERPSKKVKTREDNSWMRL